MSLVYTFLKPGTYSACLYIILSQEVKMSFMAFKHLSQPIHYVQKVRLNCTKLFISNSSHTEVSPYLNQGVLRLGVHIHSFAGGI